MALSHSPSIVTNGLVLCLDAANRKNYDNTENLLTYSEQFDDASWTKIATSVSANTTIAPDGTLTADTVTISAGGHVLRKEISVTQNTQYTFSFYVKRGTAANLGYSVYNLTASAEFITATSYYSQTSATDWVRISVTFTTPSGCTSIGVYPFRDGGATGTAFVWGAQLEIGSTANSYYATTSTAKNRGTIWSDLSGRGNTGTLTNGVGYNNSNIGSFVFDGVDDYITCGNPSSLNFGTGNFTISFIVYTTAYGFQGGSYVGKGNGTTIGFDFRDGGFFLYGTTGLIAYNSFAATLNVWEHHTIVYDSSSSPYVKFYKNGTYTGGSTTNNAGNISSIDTSEPLRIGLSVAGGPTRYFNGRMPLVQAYNRALTAAEIQQNFNALRGRFGI